MRGNPYQVHEKYLALARDAQSDDPVLAENLLQHADHYFRLINEANGAKAHRDDSRQAGGNDGENTSANRHDDNNGEEVERLSASAAQDDGAASPVEALSLDVRSDEVPQEDEVKRPRRPRRRKSSENAPADGTAVDSV